MDLTAIAMNKLIYRVTEWNPKSLRRASGFGIELDLISLTQLMRTILTFWGLVFGVWWLLYSKWEVKVWHGFLGSDHNRDVLSRGHAFVWFSHKLVYVLVKHSNTYSHKEIFLFPCWTEHCSSLLLSAVGNVFWVVTPFTKCCLLCCSLQHI